MGSPGGSSSSSKPLPLDSYMSGTLYPQMQDYYSQMSAQYPAMQDLSTWLSGNNANQAAQQTNLAGAQGDIAQEQALVGGLSSKQGFSDAMQPYLESAYQGIGASGMPQSSYGDNTLGQAVTQGYMSNVGNIMNAYNSIANQQTGVTNDVNSLSTLQGQQFNALTEPEQFIQSIQQGRYGQAIQSSSSTGGGLFK